MDTSGIYEHNGPGRIIFGPDAVQKLPQVLALDDRVLVVIDPGLVKAGILDRVTAVLSEADIFFTIYDHVMPEAPLPSIEEAATQYRKSDCSVLLAVGGGSAIDTAKAAGVLVSNPGDFLEYAQGRPIQNAIPPMTAVPTTAGTGSEVTDATIVANHQTNIKMVLRGGSLLLPHAAILDPKLLAGLPPQVAAETGIDALSHALESLVSRLSQPFSDALALHAIRLIFVYLRRLVADPGDVKAAGNMLVASNLAGQSFNNAGLGMVHGLAHPLGAHFHLSHGRACALYLPVVMKFNLEVCADKYQQAALAMGTDMRGLSDQQAAKKAIQEVEQLLKDLRLPSNYTESGISFELRDEIVEQVMAMPARQINPRLSEKKDIKNLFNSLK